MPFRQSSLTSVRTAGLGSPSMRSRLRMDLLLLCELLQLFFYPPNEAFHSHLTQWYLFGFLPTVLSLHMFIPTRVSDRPCGIEFLFLELCALDLPLFPDSAVCPLSVCCDCPFREGVLGWVHNSTASGVFLLHFEGYISPSQVLLAQLGHQLSFKLFL